MRKNVLSIAAFLESVCRVCGDFSEKIPTKIVICYGETKTTLKSDITITVDVVDKDSTMALENRLIDIVDSLDSRIVALKAYMKQDYLCQSTVRLEEKDENDKEESSVKQALSLIPEMMKTVNESAKYAHENANTSHRSLDKALDMNTKLMGELNKLRQRLIETESLLAESRILIDQLEKMLKEVSGEDSAMKEKLMGMFSTLLEQHAPTMLAYIATKMLPTTASNESANQT